MIETYALAACVFALGVAFLLHRLRVSTRFDVLEDTIRDTRGTAEKAERASRRCEATHNSDQDDLRSTG